jgi:GTPase SAR1 family protein
LPNPFLSAVSSSPLEHNPADVSEINSPAFEKCRHLIADVRERKITQSLTLFGEPGSGKTHLLSRLRESLENDALNGQESLFIPIRMVTTATMLWRFLRRHLAAALLRQRGDKKRALTRVIQTSHEEIEEQDRNLAIVLGNLINGAHFGDSAAWLRGDDLPEETLRTLGISALSDEDELEAASRRMVMMICSLSEPVPFVFCFDQLEALQSFPGDTAGFFKLGQVISDMYDSTSNVALLSCLQTSLLPELESAVRGADRDRMLSRRAGLLPLNWQQALKLIHARLATVPELKDQHPIEEAGLKSLFQPDGLCVARKVIVRCQDLFNAWQQTPPLPAEPLEAALERKYRNLQRTPRVEDAEGILRTGLPAMLRLRGIKQAAAPLPNSALDSILGGKKPTAVAICNQKVGQVLIRRLERVNADWQASGVPGLLILRDARNGVGVGAKKTRDTVEKLEKAGARIVNVSADALAALEAISRLLADARSGDLTHRGDAVSAATVEQWLASHMLRPVDELLDELGGEREVAPDELLRMLTELLARTKVISVDDAASQLSKTAEEVEECGRRNASLVGFAGGNKRVLFRVVEWQPAAGNGRE